MNDVRRQSEHGGGEVPADPWVAGFVGRRRANAGGLPIPDGNRAERRAYRRMVEQQARATRRTSRGSNRREGRDV